MDEKRIQINQVKNQGRFGPILLKIKPIKKQYLRLIRTSGLLRTPKLGFSKTNSICGGGGS